MMKAWVVLAIGLMGCSGTGGAGTTGGGPSSTGGGKSGTGGGSASTGGGSVSTGGGSVSTGGGSASTGGGSASTGGGSVSTGGGSVSTGGGSVSTGGGSVSTGGGTSGFARLTVPTFVFAPQVVASTTGVFHIVHRTQTPERIVYGQCATNCGDGANWSFIELESGVGFVGEPRIAVGADQKVHVVYRLASNSKNNYATCASNCLSVSSWSKVELATPAECDWDGAHSNLILDPSGRLSFISTDFNTVRLCINTCTSGCTTPANWSSGLLVNVGSSARRIPVGFASTGSTLHLMYDDLNSGLRLASCTTDCGQPSSWQFSSGLFYHGDTPIAVSATASGRLSLAYNQGTTPASAPAEVKGRDDRLLLWECSADCAQPTAWQGVYTGNTNDGSEGVAVLSFGSSTIAVTTQASGARGFVCANSCSQADRWSNTELETTATLAADLPDPASVLGCTSAGGNPVPPDFAAWNPEVPSITRSPQGTVVVHTMTRGLRTCPGVGSPTAFPGYGRILYWP